MAGVTLDRLKELLHYDPIAGEFTWRIKPSRRYPAGAIAGSVNTRGYRNICIERRWYGAHRLAWLWVHGRWPSRYIDHINGKCSDNRIANLREASPAQSAHNRSSHCDSKSKFKGVVFRPHLHRWEANIMANGIRAYLGQFATALAAHEAYREAAKKLHGEFAKME